MISYKCDLRPKMCQYSSMLALPYKNEKNSFQKTELMLIFSARNVLEIEKWNGTYRKPWAERKKKETLIPQIPGGG
jgi:hypothetical protein